MRPPVPGWGEIYRINGREYRAISDGDVVFLGARRSFDSGRLKRYRYVWWPDGSLTLGRDYPDRSSPLKLEVVLSEAHLTGDHA